MTGITYAIKESDKTTEGVVTIAANDAWGQLEFSAGQTVMVTANGQRKFFIACPRKGAEGGDLYVKTKSFKSKNLNGTVTLTTSNPLCARLHFVFRTLDGWLLWVGLVMTGAAAVVQAVKSASSAPSPCLGFWTAAFQIVGLIMAFIGAVRTRKP
jgi:hypothetical protein